MDSQHLGATWLPGPTNTVIPFLDPWIEDWPEMDHPFRGSHKQPPDFREKLALPLLPPFHLPPPMSFPYPLLQPSPPPLIPPLHQNAPFFQGQPFPPYEFFKHSAMEDFSMPSNLGRCLYSLCSHLPQTPVHILQPSHLCSHELGSWV